MKVIVFGGSGFLGSHVADALTGAGHDVIVYDKKKSSFLQNGQPQIIGDINDEKKVAEAIKGCEVVYNFAGMADLEEVKNKPLDAVRSNILGNTVLLEAARRNKVKRFVFASTLYVYSKSGSFYRSSKQACELLIDNYREVYGLDYTILRYGSLYGPRADDSNWIYQALKQALTENKLVRHGDGNELRDYIHVLDAARLSVDILKEEYRNQHVIITGHQQIRIKDLLTMINEILNNKAKIEFLTVDSNDHYEMTPYTFEPRIAKRIQGNNYVDLGQGILHLIGEIYKETCPPGGQVKEYVEG